MLQWHRLLNDEDDNIKEGIVHTPKNEPETPPVELSDSAQKTNGSIYGSRKLLEFVTPFGQRKNKFVVQFTLNGPTISKEAIKQENDDDTSEYDIIKRPQPIRRCSIHISGSQPEIGCRFMYDRIEDKVFLFCSFGLWCLYLTSH